MNTAYFSTAQGVSIQLETTTPAELQNALKLFGITVGGPVAVALDPTLGTVAGTKTETKTTKSSPEKPAETKPAEQASEQGNAASTSQAAQGSAQAADAGSTGATDNPHPYSYNDVSARIVSLCKLQGGREKCVSLLKSFGEKIDHGNKLPLESYVSFVEQADKLLAGSAA